MVDSSSAVSLLPKRDFDSAGKLRSYCGRVVSVCGGMLEIVGLSAVELAYDDVILVRDFLICDDVRYPILGMDFFSSFSVVVDIPSRALKMQGRELPFVFSTEVEGPEAKPVASVQNLDDVLAEFPSVLRGDRYSAA